MNAKSFFSFFQGGKKVFFVSSVLVLFLAACGFFYYIWHMPNSPLYRWWVEEMEMGGGPKDFSIEKSDLETMVINKREKFQAQVPDGWSAVEAEQSSYRDWGVNLFSHDVEVKAYSAPYNFVLDDGCVIGIFVEKGNLKYDVANDAISEIPKTEKSDMPSLEEDEIEFVKVGSHQGVAYLMTNSERIGRVVEVVVPLKDERYIYSKLTASPEKIEECSSIFEKFLENISDNN